MAVSENLVTVELQVSGGLSMVFCFFLFASYAMFEELRSRHYIKLVMNVCIGCFCTCVAIVLGAGMKNNSTGCWVQGMAVNYFALTSVLWVLVISYELYKVVLKSRVLRTDHTIYHYMVWLFPLVTTLLPLTTNTYGRIDGQVDVCFISDRSDSPSWGRTFWIIMSFYLWVWLTILFILIQFFRIAHALRNKSGVPASIRRSVNMLGTYPLILVLCWVVPSFSRMWYIFAPASSDEYTGYYEVTLLGNCLPYLMGALVSLATFIASDEIRRCWYEYVFGEASQEEVLNSKTSMSYRGGKSRSFQAQSALMDAASADPSMVAVTNPMGAGGTGSGSGSVDHDLYDEDDVEEERMSRYSSRLSRFLAPTFGFAMSGPGGSPGSDRSSHSSRASGVGGPASSISMKAIPSSGNLSAASGAAGSDSSSSAGSEVYSSTPAAGSGVPMGSVDNPVPPVPARDPSSHSGLTEV